MSLRDTILAADDLEKRDIEVPEWGVTIRLVSPTGEDRATLMRQTVDTEGNVKEDWPLLWPLAIVCCARDPETNERVFEWGDVATLQSDKSATVLARLGDTCLDLAGLKQDALEGAKKSPPE